jgi:hypothetical protein
MKHLERRTSFANSITLSSSQQRLIYCWQLVQLLLTCIMRI